MNKFLKKLIQNDNIINDYTDTQVIINQGLAPIVALSNPSLTLQKADLLEQSKYINWQDKATVLFNQLDQNGIRFLVFKGFAYSYLLYDQKHIRPYSDIDILIDENDYKKTEKLFEELNYKRFPSRQGKFISYQNSFYHSDSSQTIIDLHWQINNRLEIHPYFQFKQLYQTSVEIKSPDFKFKSLNTIDAFLLACFHYHGHRPEDRKHIWLYDLALLWHDINTETQKECLKAAEIKQLSQIVDSLLSRLNKTFSLNIDLSQRKTSTSEHTNTYLNNRKRKISDVKIRFKNIKGFKNKILFLSEYIFQSTNYVKNRYNIKSNIVVYFYYPRMWTEDLFKLFKR